MARQLINGQFWLEDEELNEHENELNLKNAQVFGKADPTEQICLDQFEKQLNEIMKQTEQGSSVDDLLGKDNIPPEIREEFNLPEDMKGQEIDYSEIRIRDVQIAIKYPTWSGQDVLSTSLNMK